MHTQHISGIRTRMVALFLSVTLTSGVHLASGAPPAPGAADSAEAQIASLQALKQFQTPADQYTIGEGDQLEIQVVGRPELSGSHLVGPDGRITLPVTGPFEIRDMTREDAARAIASTFQKYYDDIDVTVRVSKYGSSRILVLGHVDQPGVLYFDGTPTLFDVLTKTRRATLGAGPAAGFPARCAIFRGKDEAVWIDLKAMMDSGSAIADINLRRNDVVYVPDEKDDQVSVLGEVQRPGMIRLGPTTTLAEVLALSGGLTAAAGSAKIEIVRPGSKTTEIAFKDLLDPSKNIEAPLRSGDVVYVQKGTAAKFAYALQQLAPISGMLMFAAAVR